MSASLEQLAKKSLSELVAHVFAHRDGLIGPMTYEELAARIGRMNKHGKGHGHGMGAVLGRMGHLVEGLGDEWGEPIPHLQSLVVMKNGSRRGLPDDGISEFWDDYPQMSRSEKENRVKAEHQKIVAFGSRWNDVLSQLGLEPIAAEVAPRHYGKSGESQEHVQLKLYVQAHPELVGATAEWQSFVEYPLPTFNEIDVLFRSRHACIAVEVKAAVSDALPDDYKRGLYQTVKYGALLAAMAKDPYYQMPASIRSVLVLASSLPKQYTELRNALRTEVIENVNVEE